MEDIEHRFKDRNAEEEIVRRRERLAHRPANEAMLVAKQGERVVGFCRVSLHQDKNQLVAIYVLPEFHGRGIGSALWRQARTHLDPAKTTFVEVAVYNAQAIGFYRRHGFTETGKRMADPKFTMRSGAILPELEMRREAESESGAGSGLDM